MDNKKLSLKQIERIFTEILYPEFAQDWDNVGLLVGNGEQKIERILVCIDLTSKVLQEARTKNVQLIFAYHPPIFEPIKSITSETQPILFSAIRNNIAIYSIHTALDVIDGGTSDALADIIDLNDREPIELIDADEKLFKLVVFVPADAVEKVSQALFDADAGQIGQYSRCSFRTEGTGTFFGDENTNPAIGKANRFEKVKEIRLEVLVRKSVLSNAITALLKVHPYEQPAFDIYPLENENISKKQIGLGRIGLLKKPATLSSIIAKIKRKTGLKKLIVSDAGINRIRRVACCPGSCGKIAERLAGDVDLFLTGEVRHHTALHLTEKKTSLICLGHGNSERIALAGLCKMLKRDKRLKNIKFITSKKDKDPLTII